MKVVVPDKLKSRKLWVALIGAGLSIANSVFELNLDMVQIETMLATFIIGEAYIDAHKY